MCVNGCKCTLEVILGRHVVYSLDNLRRYVISHGENYDSILEKFALQLDHLRDSNLRRENEIKDILKRLEILEKNAL